MMALNQVLQLTLFFSLFSTNRVFAYDAHLLFISWILTALSLVRLRTSIEPEAYFPVAIKVDGNDGYNKNEEAGSSNSEVNEV